MGWYEDMEKAEQEREALLYELAFNNGYEIIEQAFDIGCICLYKIACEEGIISDNEKFEKLLHRICKKRSE